jgi:hypothetical protein
MDYILAASEGMQLAPARKGVSLGHDGLPSRTPYPEHHPQPER